MEKYILVSIPSVVARLFNELQVAQYVAIDLKTSVPIYFTLNILGVFDTVHYRGEINATLTDFGKKCRLRIVDLDVYCLRIPIE